MIPLKAYEALRELPPEEMVAILRGFSKQPDARPVTSRMAENIWVAAGIAGWFVAGYIGWLLIVYAPLGHVVNAAGISLIVFLIGVGIYAFLVFGLDEPTAWLWRAILESKLEHSKEALAEKDRRIEGLLDELQEATRPINVVRRDDKVVTEHVSIEHVKRILFRRRHGVSYAREVLCDEHRYMTQADWAFAFALLGDAGHARKGGKGGKQWILDEAADERVLNDVRVELIKRGLMDAPSPSPARPEFVNAL